MSLQIFEEFIPVLTNLSPAQLRNPCEVASLQIYFGESVLLPEYRGQGIGHAFFDAREEHARAEGANAACFASVIRPGRSSAAPCQPSSPRRVLAGARLCAGRWADHATGMAGAWRTGRNAQGDAILATPVLTRSDRACPSAGCGWTGREHRSA